MKNAFRPSQTTSLFADEFRLAKLTTLGDPLEKLNKVIDWNSFREIVEKVLTRDKMLKSGAKPYDPLLMFKILILQRYYNLGDHNLEYQILDRLTFCRFLGLSKNDRVPDEKTIWSFREKFINKGLEKEAFDHFNHLLTQHGLIAEEGKIIDASFVEAPRQRNSRDENKQIKNGEVPKEWDENPHKKCQKDTDARWTKKNDETHYGYKDHIKIDAKYKFIDTYKATDASVHDSQTLDDLLNEKDKGQDLYADSAYTGPNQQATIDKYRMNNKVHEKGAKNRPLTEEQKKANKTKSKTRARVEHPFGFMEQNMNKLYIRSIGFARANGFVGLENLTYNLCRYEQVVRINHKTIANWG